MGKKGGSWFSSVKKVFRSSSKDSPVPERKKENADKWPHEGPEVVSFEHFPAESSPDDDITNEGSTTSTPMTDERNHNNVVVVATAVAAEAAVAAAQATARAIRLAGYRRQSEEDRAATLIQSHYRSYLARRARRALKGLVRLQALVRGHNVRKQAQMTMRSMQALVRVQARVRARRLQLQLARDRDKLHYNSTVEKHDSKPMSPFHEDRWDKRHPSFQKIKENNDFTKQEAVMNKERALAYAFNYRQQQKQFLHADPTAEELEKAKWGWNWLERWMSSDQRHQLRHLGPPETSYFNLPTTTTTSTPTTDDMSEKTVEMDIVAPPRSSGIMGQMGRDLFLDSSPIIDGLHQTHPNSDVPSYMAPTQSAKAKVRGQGPTKSRASSVPQWNSSTRKSSVIGPGSDSSSFCGGTSTYQFMRSPSPKINGLRLQSRRISGGSPDYVGSEDWALPLGAQGWA